MYKITKRLEVAGAHSLALGYESKCKNLHGHNWIINITCEAKALNEFGMVVDFAHIKRDISDALDHKNLNDIFGFNPTAENIAAWIVNKVPHCVKAEIWESEGNMASYEL